MATSLIIETNRVILEHTGAAEVKKTGSTHWGIWNAEQLLRKEKGEYPFFGHTILKEYKQ